MSLTNTTGRLRYVAPLLLIVAVAACSKQDEAAPATTPAAATPAAPPPPAVSAEVQAMDADARQNIFHDMMEIALETALQLD